MQYRLLRVYLSRFILRTSHDATEEVSCTRTASGHPRNGVRREVIEMQGILKCAWGAAALAIAQAVWADEVTPEQARMAAANWVAKSPKRLTAKFGAANVGKTLTSTNEKGLALYHVVNLADGGFVVTSGDTQLPPVIVFSEAGELNLSDKGNPLHTLLERDMAGRIAALSGRQTPQKAVAGGGKNTFEEEWAALLQPNDRDKMSYGAVDSLSDVRVAPMVQSQWGQSTWNGYNTFNYYTPNKYVSGCVATAFAQIMRYWQKPATSVTAGSYRCWVSGTGSTYTMKGGTYAWGSMPLTASACTSDTQRQAIGKLLYDVGVASQMDWGSGGSSAMGYCGSKALRSRFGYASSQAYFDITGYGLYQDMTTRQPEFRNAILASLDAGMPVAIGVGGDDGGHEMVADGYGYDGSMIYCHLNCGWSGSEDAWYNLLGDYITSYSFGYLDEVGYNIHPTASGDVISGRVLDASGNAVSGATVTLTLPGGGTKTATSNTKGIYFFRVTSSGTYKVSASKGSQTSNGRSVALTMSVSCTATLTSNGDVADASGNSVFDSAGDYIGSSDLGGTLGNSWGNDLTLGAAASSNARFEVGETSQFTVSGTQRATLVGMANVQWSDFSGTDAFGTKVFVNANIVDAEKTAGSAMKDDDTWCYPLSDMNALFWTGWAQAATTFSTVDSMANYFRADPTLLRTWDGGPVEGDYGYDGLFDWFYDETEEDIWCYTTFGGIDRSFGETIRPLLDDGSHVIRLAVYFRTTNNPKWSWCNSSGGVSHGVLCVGYVADTSKASSDPTALKALFIVDPDNSQSTNGGGASAPNTIAYCPVTWNSSTGEWIVQGIWGETSVLCNVYDEDDGYRAIGNYGTDSVCGAYDAISDAVDCSSLWFSQYGRGSYEGWFAQSEVSRLGGSAMQSGRVGKDSWSSFYTEIEGPAYVDFLWKLVSSYSGGIGLSTYLDEETQIDYLVTGSSQWEYSFAEIPAGTHRLEWCFFNNVSDAAGDDTTGYVDWISVAYGITVDTAGGSGSVDFATGNSAVVTSGSMTYGFAGESVTLPSGSGLSRDGYEFDGWTFDGAAHKAGDTVTMPSHPVKLTARWKQAQTRFVLAYGSLNVLNTKGSYYGHIFDADNWIVGTLEIKAAALKNSASRLQATLSLQGSAPIKLKGATTGWNGGMATATLSGSGKVIQMWLCHENVYGLVNGSYFFDCARNFAMDLKGGGAYKSRINAAKRNYALSMLSIPATGTTSAGNGFIGTSIQVGLKGKTKLVGVLPDLGKINGTVYLEADDRDTYVPVYTPINVRKGSYGAVLLSTSSCKPVNAAYGIWNNKGGKKNLAAYLKFDEASLVARPSTSRFRWLIPDSALSLIPSSIAGGAVQYAAFPGYYTVCELAFSANKWTAVGDAISKMKLTYAPKTALIKGSFYATTTKGKKKVTVNGVFVGSWGDCSININKSHTAPALIYAN